MCEHLQSAERSSGPAIYQRRSLVVPTTTGEPSALAIVCGVFGLANPIDRQLPDTVFHLRKNVVYAGHALGSAEDGDRCRVVQRGDRCSEPSKSCILVTQNFCGPGDRPRQFLGVCLLSRDKVCRNERTAGNPNIQIPEGARAPRPHSLSCPRHQFDSTSASSVIPRLAEHADIVLSWGNAR